MAALAPSAAARADEPAPVTAPEARPPDSNHRVSVRLGFAHWFSGALGQPDGFLTPALAVGVRPGVSFLELCARYTVAPGRLTLGSGARTVVGFVSLELLASHEVRSGGHALRVFGGLLGALVHTEQSAVGYGYGITLGADLLFDVSSRGRLAVGPFLAVREIFHVLPGGAGPTGLVDGWNRDAHIDLGVVASFL